jgi:hypothetical protein
MAVTYESIATTTLGSGVSTYTFSSIPQTYTDLVIVVSAVSTNGTSGSYVNLRFNGDTTTNCYQTSIEAGSGNISERTSSTYFVCNWHGSAFQSTTQWCAYYGHIMSYANTSVKKNLMGQWNGTSEVNLAGGTWPQTSAVTSITVFNPTYNFGTGSTFTLYGIKAA